MDVSSLTPRIRDILQASDLSTVSAKKVRRQLEHEMGTSLDSFKTEIDDIIKNQFQQIHNETQQRQQVQQQYASQYAVQQQQQQQGHMGVYGVPPSIAGLQMPPGAYHSSAMHHAGGPGMLPPGIMPGASGSTPVSPEDATPRKRGRPRKPENEKKQQRRKQRVVDPNKPKRQTGLSKPMKLSPDLRAFLDQKYCARTDVVKKLWAYIKQHDLQDPADKRYILCDDQLNTLFHTDRLYMYTMNKLLNEHLVKPTPEENAEAIVLLGLPPSHPANADSVGILPPTSVAAGSVAAASGSPAPSDAATSAVSDTQHTADNSADEEDEDHDNDNDNDNDSLPVSPTDPHHQPQTQPQPQPQPQSISASLALPPQPANSNATG
ncbi:hypothetical protein LPJ53_004906 [Coemansia erecta]|uniref:SWIB-domain-containing protein n=1 Tax=Coemansia erecta TaxID=147472 RepID=A0A9W7XXW5_9FUNG|nr:hypothetical protein LPJ53_004906 [Coemansia erecta]